uniref:Carbonic anhydrase n=1 Tax=Lates calcarifer TaxID=8187 RepID=A0A4W6G793_LATCA
MYRCTLLLCLSLGALVKCAAGSDWCYSGCEYSPTHWHEIPHSSCGGNRQSPIDIVTSHVKMDPHLDNFTFVNFSSQRVIKNIINTGHTVKCNLENDQVELSGGGLNGLYSTIQFHFHWGDTKHHPGSEHTVDGHRYSMEMHIVSLKTGLSVEEALNDPEGIAVLGFFINATEDGDMFGPWDSLTSYLVNLTDTDVTLHNISIDDLIGNVDRTRFYRYNGSLTTPNCSEAVVWTVFHEPINVNKKLIERFPVHMKVTNVYRPVQDLGTRHVFASPATPLPPGHSWCYDDHCEYSPSQWHLLPDSQCGGESQSPINIDTKHIVVDEHLDSLHLYKV